MKRYLAVLIVACCVLFLFSGPASASLTEGTWDSSTGLTQTGTWYVDLLSTSGWPNYIGRTGIFESSDAQWNYVGTRTGNVTMGPHIPIDSNSFYYNYSQNYNNATYTFTYTDDNYYTATGTGYYTTDVYFSNNMYSGAHNIVWNGEGIITQGGDTYLVTITLKGDETFNNLSNINYNSSFGSTVHGGTLTYNQLTINKLDPVTNSGTVSNSGTLVNNEMLTNSGTQTNTGTLTNNGVLTNSGVIDGGGIFTQTAGITTNTGTINQEAFVINGGTFNQDAGSLAVDSLVNNGQFDYSGGTLAADSITNQGIFNLNLDETGTVTGNFFNEGTVMVTESTVNFTGNYTENGILDVDPSTVGFNNLTLGSTGMIRGDAASSIYVGGTLQGLRIVNGVVTNFYGGMNVYYDPADNPGLGGLTYSLSRYNGSEGGSLMPTPIPATVWLLGPTLLGLIGIKRKRERS